MSPVSVFKLILIAIGAIIGLELLARRLRLPSAAALLVGGAALAFVPGLPHIEIDPELVLVVFLPPLLMDGAYVTMWDEFRRHLKGILLLAVGAVAFTTLVVGLAVHWVMPSLPWAACFALGAIVSPPDAIAAAAVLERVPLPRSLRVLLEGESLLNDATGLVLYRLALVAVLTGTFSSTHAIGSFFVLALGGVLVGLVYGYVVLALVRLIRDTSLAVVVLLLSSWICYLIGDACGVSGVMATVTWGMMLGWHQHSLVTATIRTRATAFWQIMVFVMESLVFILIGLSLRGVITRIDSGESLAPFMLVSAAVVAAVVGARFVWMFGSDGVEFAWHRLVQRRRHARLDWRASIVKGWAGMRGVVTLAVALSMPASVPGRDLILFAAFAVIVVTVLVQSITIEPLIRLLRFDTQHRHDARYLTEPAAWARLEAAQYAAIEKLAYDTDGVLQHPRLLEQYGYRARLSNDHRDDPEVPATVRHAHYDTVLAALEAGRAELLDMHRSGLLHDELLHVLERDLDLQEVLALHGRGE
jgi:monovalent cation/hydrogen antiporter